MNLLITLMMTALLAVVAPLNAVFAITSESKFRCDPPDDTYYYEYSEVLFGSGMDSEGNILEESTQFRLPQTGSTKITVGVFNDKAFLTNKVLVEIYNQESELVDEFTLDVQPDWDWFKFEIELEKEGTYYLDIYNEIDVFINSGTVDVVR